MSQVGRCLNDAVVDWWRANPDMIPESVEALSEYPMIFRRMLMNVVDASARAALWTEHLGSFLADDSGLTDAQQDFVRETIDGLDGVNPPDDEWRKNAANLFSREEMIAVFMRLGPAEPDGGLPNPPGFVYDEAGPEEEHVS